MGITEKVKELKNYSPPKKKKAAADASTGEEAGALGILHDAICNIRYSICDYYT